MRPSTPEKSSRILKVAVFGGKGGGSHAALTILNLSQAGQPYSFAGYLNDRLPIGTPIYGGNVLCSFDAWASLEEDLRFLAPLHQAGRMQQNCARILELGIPNSRWATVIGAGSVVAENSSIGRGSYCPPFCKCFDGQRGRRALFDSALALASGMTSRSATLCLSVLTRIICSSARIESGAHIGPGAAVGNDVRVGRFAVVGLGAVVTKDVPDYAVVVGNPARVLRMIEPVAIPTLSFT